VVQLTNNFTSEAPLAPSVREAIAIALADGWADPKKSSQASTRAAALRQGCLEELASHCGAQTSQLEVVGEPNLAYFLAISGLLSPDLQLVTSTVDLGKIRAVARAHSGEKFELAVGSDGRYTNLSEIPAKPSLVVVQSRNGETGVSQKSVAEITEDFPATHNIILDASHDVPNYQMLTGVSSAVFDSASWNGPSGLGLLYIAEPAKYRYALPHIAPIRTPGSYSLPLLVGATVALTLFKQSQEAIFQLRRYAVAALSKIEGVSVVAAQSGENSRYLSFLISDISSEELLRALQPLHIEIDAGSACSPEDLTPSHVIAAMGLPTTGHMRITLHTESTESEIDYLVANIALVLSQLRG
jgi:cysteine desulfurase